MDVYCRNIEFTRDEKLDFTIDSSHTKRKMDSNHLLFLLFFSFLLEYLWRIIMQKPACPSSPFTLGQIFATLLYFTMLCFLFILLPNISISPHFLLTDHFHFPWHATHPSQVILFLLIFIIFNIKIGRIKLTGYLIKTILLEIKSEICSYYA